MKRRQPAFVWTEKKEGVSVTGYTKVPLIDVGQEVVTLTPFHISPQVEPEPVRLSVIPAKFIFIPGYQERFALIKRLRDRKFISRSVTFKPSAKISEVEPAPSEYIVNPDGSEREVTQVDDSGSFAIWVDGGLIKVSKPKGRKITRVRSSKRGRVFGFSAGARRRLMRKIAELRSDAMPLFATLTYPADFPSDYREWKVHLDKFAKRFNREYPGGAFVWRLEPQKRGAPHFHLLVYGVAMSDSNVDWFHHAWYHSVGSGDLKHHRWGVDIQQLRSARGVRSYVGKYIAKKQGGSKYGIDAVTGQQMVDWSLVGRWWGVRYSENLPESELFQARGLSYAQSNNFIRSMRRYLHSQGQRVSGVLSSLTIFVNNPKQWAVNLTGLIGDPYIASGSFNSIGLSLERG